MEQPSEAGLVPVVLAIMHVAYRYARHRSRQIPACRHLAGGEVPDRPGAPPAVIPALCITPTPIQAAGEGWQSAPTKPGHGVWGGLVSALTEDALLLGAPRMYRCQGGDRPGTRSDQSVVNTQPSR